MPSLPATSRSPSPQRARPSQAAQRGPAELEQQRRHLESEAPVRHAPPASADVAFSRIGRRTPAARASARSLALAEPVCDSDDDDGGTPSSGDQRAALAPAGAAAAGPGPAAGASRRSSSKRRKAGRRGAVGGAQATRRGLEAESDSRNFVAVFVRRFLAATTAQGLAAYEAERARKHPAPRRTLEHMDSQMSLSDAASDRTLPPAAAPPRRARMRSPALLARAGVEAAAATDSSSAARAAVMGSEAEEPAAALWHRNLSQRWLWVQVRRPLRVTPCHAPYLLVRSFLGCWWLARRRRHARMHGRWGSQRGRCAGRMIFSRHTCSGESCA